jgi:hypothetical protein
MRIEQLVFGSFSYTRGFTLVSASDGIAPPLMQLAVDTCKTWGEVMRSDFRSALYHRSLSLPASAEDGAPRRVHLIGKVVRQGTDDEDRIAWHHQVLIVGDHDYVAVGADMFAFDDAGLYRERWFESDACSAMDLDPSVFASADRRAIPAEQLDAAEAIMRPLLGGQVVRTLASRESALVGRLFRSALSLLPRNLRANLSLATYAYRPQQHFDLCCLHDPDSPVIGSVADVKLHVEPRSTRPDGEGIPSASSPRPDPDRIMTCLRSGRHDELDALLDGGPISNQGG